MSVLPHIWPRLKSSPHPHGPVARSSRSSHALFTCQVPYLAITIHIYKHVYIYINIRTPTPQWPSRQLSASRPRAPPAPSTSCAPSSSHTRHHVPATRTQTSTIRHPQPSSRHAVTSPPPCPTMPTRRNMRLRWRPAASASGLAAQRKSAWISRTWAASASWS